MDLLKKITEDWFNEFNEEIRRGKYPETRININWFDAIDNIGNDRRTITGSTYKGFNGLEYTKKGKFTPKPNINDIP